MQWLTHLARFLSFSKCIDDPGPPPSRTLSVQEAMVINAVLGNVSYPTVTETVTFGGKLLTALLFTYPTFFLLLVNKCYFIFAHVS